MGKLVINIVKKLKNNSFLRGIYLFYHSYFGLRKHRFAQFAENAMISAPYYIGNPNNIFIGPNVKIGPKAYISATNAKFMCKGYSAIAEGLTVHTGNHARIIGKYVTHYRIK